MLSHPTTDIHYQEREQILGANRLLLIFKWNTHVLILSSCYSSIFADTLETVIFGQHINCFSTRTACLIHCGIIEQEVVIFLLTRGRSN